MTALHRVKAYFGMVPADELDAYDGYGDRPGGRYDGRTDDRYDQHEGRHDGRYDSRVDDRYDDRHDARHEDRYESRHDVRSRSRFDERPEDRHDRFSRPEPHRDEHERTAPRRRTESGPADEAGEGGGSETHRPRTPRPRDPEHTENRHEEPDAVDTTRTPRGRGWAHNTGPNHTSVRPGPSVGSARSVPSLSPVPSTGATGSAGSPSLGRGSSSPETRTGEKPTATEPAAPSEITSLQPKSYNEARVIGERYRDGIPVIMNLSEMDDVAAKRLVDFAAGLAFALRGSIEKVTNRVFLLSPPNVEVSASDRRKLAETGYSVSS